jgi:hypothetical protein
MIRHTDPALRTTSFLRFYKEESEDPFAEFDAVCLLVWNEARDEVWIEGFKGELSMSLLKEMARFMVDRGVKKIRAKRSSQRKLPGAKRQADGSMLIIVSEMAERFGEA